LLSRIQLCLNAEGFPKKDKLLKIILFDRTNCLRLERGKIYIFKQNKILISVVLTLVKLYFLNNIIYIDHLTIFLFEGLNQLKISNKFIK
jgi:hypothetical protein